MDQELNSAASILALASKMAIQHANDIGLVIVCNTKTETATHVGAHESVMTEFYSDHELSEVLRPLRRNHFNVLGIYDEDEFAQAILSRALVNQQATIVVINFASARLGPWGKTLVPALATSAGLLTTNSDPYAIALTRHKAHTSYILSSLGLTPQFCWCYEPHIGWYAGSRPPIGTSLLLQPAYESASIGVTNTSRCVADDSLDSLVIEIAREYRQAVVARTFIEGYEVECPVVTGLDAVAMDPVGISIQGSHRVGDQYLTYERVYSDNYQFFSYRDIAPPHIAELLQVRAIHASQVLGLRGFSRIDFRITDSGSMYITDVSASPHFVSHSSFAFAAAQAGLEPDILILSLLGLALMRSNYPSDQY